MGASRQAGEGRAEAGITTNELSEPVRRLWEELVTVTRHLAELDLDEEDSDESLRFGQQRQLELRQHIEIMNAEKNLGDHHRYISECLEWEHQLQQRLMEAREKYRQPYNEFQQAKKLRSAYNHFQTPDGFFVDRNQ